MGNKLKNLISDCHYLSAAVQFRISKLISDHTKKVSNVWLKNLQLINFSLFRVYINFFALNELSEVESTLSGRKIIKKSSN